MSYYGNTPNWVYKQEIDSLKNANRISETQSKEDMLKAIKKILGVVDYSIIAIWCDLNGYYYPIKKDFEKLNKINQVEKQIKELESEIAQIKYRYALSWKEKGELDTVDERIKEKETEIENCKGSDPVRAKKATTQLKSLTTRKINLIQLKEDCDKKISEESKEFLRKQDELRREIAKIKNEIE